MIDGALAVTGPTLAVLGYVAVIGAALRVLLGRWVTLPRGLGVTAGLGLALAVVTVSTSYVVARSATAPIVPLFVVSAGLVLAVAARALGRRHAPDERWRAGLATLTPIPSDAVALGAAYVTLGSILRSGLTSWTAGTDDIPNYVASAQVWLSGGARGAAFLQAHPDPFGTWQVHRAVTEKPMATALLVVVERVAGTQPYSALTPVMLLSVFVLVSGLFTLATAVLRVPAVLAVPAVLVPTFSVVPMSRVFDAQIGQVMAVALASVVLVVLAGSRPPPGRTGRWVQAAVAAVSLTACVGSNPTLILGTSLTLGALAVWLARRAASSSRALVGQWTRVAVVVAVLSAPFVTWYAASLARQTTGEAGFSIPLAGPLALIGMQKSLTDVASSRVVLLQWAVLLVVGGCGYLVCRWSHRSGPATGVLVALTVANGGVLAVSFGVTNYSTHKWLAVAVSLVAPLVLARFAHSLGARARWFVAILLAGLAVHSAAICWAAGGSVRYTASKDLIALSSDERLAAVGTVNVSLGSLYENSIAPLVIDAPRVVVVSPTYAEGAPVAGDWMLTQASDQAAWPHDEVIQLNTSYVLLHLDLELAPGSVAFGPDTPAHRGYLSGTWYPTASAGELSAGGSAWIVFDLAKELRAGDVVVTLDGRQSPAPPYSAALQFTVNGRAVEPTTLGDLTTGGRLQVTIPAALAMADGGRVSIHLSRTDPIPRSDIGEADGRELGFWLTGLGVARAVS